MLNNSLFMYKTKRKFRMELKEAIEFYNRKEYEKSGKLFDDINNVVNNSEVIMNKV